MSQFWGPLVHENWLDIESLQNTLYIPQLERFCDTGVISLSLLEQKMFNFSKTAFWSTIQLMSLIWILVMMYF